MRQLAEGSSGASRQARFTRRRLPPMARTRMGDIVMGNQRYKHRGTNAFYTKWLRALFENRVVYGVPKTWAVTILTLEQNPPKRIFIYISDILSGGFCSKVKIVTAQVFGTLPKVFFLS